jgi:hypothetical protein
MPWSWIRVPLNTSEKLVRHLDGDRSASKFEASMRTIAEHAGADDVQVGFEPNGLYAMVHFTWRDPDVKFAVIYDLEGEHVMDLLRAEDLERLAARD